MTKEIIARPLVLKRGWKSIAGAMGVGQQTVRGWQRQGAPIYLVDGRWTAELSELWEWIKDPEGYDLPAA